MLLGWLFMGGAAIGGKITNIKRQVNAKEKGYAHYCDAYGTTRYTDTGLPKSELYESLKDPNHYYEKVRILEEQYSKYMASGKTSPGGRKYYEDKIAEEKQKAEEIKRKMREFDDIAKKQLKKQGYKF